MLSQPIKKKRVCAAWGTQFSKVVFRFFAFCFFPPRYGAILGSRRYLRGTVPVFVDDVLVPYFRAACGFVERFSVVFFFFCFRFCGLQPWPVDRHRTFSESGMRIFMSHDEAENNDQLSNFKRTVRFCRMFLRKRVKRFCAWQFSFFFQNNQPSVPNEHGAAGASYGRCRKFGKTFGSFVFNTNREQRLKRISKTRLFAYNIVQSTFVWYDQIKRLVRCPDKSGQRAEVRLKNWPAGSRKLFLSLMNTLLLTTKY